MVERTNAWISRRRARDYEHLPAHHEAMVQLAAIIQLTAALTSFSGHKIARDGLILTVITVPA